MTGAALAADPVAGSVGGIIRSTAVPHAALSGSARFAARDLLLVKQKHAQSTRYKHVSCGA